MTISALPGDEAAGPHRRCAARRYFPALRPVNRGKLSARRRVLGPAASGPRPENWGAWLCQGGGEVGAGASPRMTANFMTCFLRPRVSAPIGRTAHPADGQWRAGRIWDGGTIGSAGPQHHRARIRLARRWHRPMACCGWASRPICHRNCGRRSRRLTGALRRSVASNGFVVVLGKRPEIPGRYPARALLA
mgnify:CR=1 FL=1